MHTCNLNARDVEVGRSGVQVQPWLHSEFEPGWDTWNLSQRETGTQTSRRKDHNIHISIARVQSSAFSILGTISSLIVEEPSGLNCYREQLDEAAFQRVPGLPHNDKTVQSSLGGRDRIKEESHTPHSTVCKSHYTPQYFFSSSLLQFSHPSSHYIKYTHLQLYFIQKYSALSDKWSVMAVLLVLNVWICSMCSKQSKRRNS